MDSILPPGVFEGALHAFLIGEFFIESIRMTIRAGVCNCSRVIRVGTIWGAFSGGKAIQQNWIQQTHSSSELKHLLNKLLASIEWEWRKIWFLTLLAFSATGFGILHFVSISRSPPYKMLLQHLNSWDLYLIQVDKLLIASIPQNDSKKLEWI